MTRKRWPANARWREHPWAVKRAAERAAKLPQLLQRRAEAQAKRAARQATSYMMPAAIRAATWRRLNAGLMVKHVSLFNPYTARENDQIRPDLTEWAGTTLIQSDERSYA